MRKRKIEITVERERVIEMSRHNRFVERCEQCSKQVKIVRVDEAAHLAGASQRLVNRWVEEGRVHFFESAEVLLFICLDSLAALSRL